MSSLRVEKHGNTWRYRFETAPVGGKRKRIGKSGYRTKGEAIKAGTEAMNEYLNAGFTFTPAELSFSDFLDEWLEMNQTSWKPSTIAGYKKQIELHIRPYLGKYRLASISTRVIQDHINKLFNKGVAHSSLTNVKARLTGSLDWAVKMNYIKYNPARAAALPSRRASPAKASKINQHIYISKEDRAKLFERFPEGHPAYIPLMLGFRAGLRLGEAFGLCWRDIDLANGTLSVNRQVQYAENVAPGSDGLSRIYLTAPKYDSYRTFKIDGMLLDLLRRRRRELMFEKARYAEYYTNYYIDSDGYITDVAPDEHAEPIDFVNIRDNGTLIRPRTIQHACREARKFIPGFDFHSLRKTHCTELLSNGANPKDVQMRLGHKKIQETLDIYTAVTKKMDDLSIDILENMMA